MGGIREMHQPSSQFNEIKLANLPAGFKEIRKGALLAWIKPEVAFLFDEDRKWIRADSFSMPSQASPYSGRGEVTRISLGKGGQETHKAPGAPAGPRHPQSQSGIRSRR